MAVNRSDGYSANTKRRVHSLRVKFTPKEDEMIKRLKEIDRLPWQEIGDLFPGRSASSSPFRREIVEILDDETEDDATVYTIEDYPRIKYEDEHEELRTPYAAPSARRLEQTLCYAELSASES
ncbi:hypothetical protein H2203_004500 [Taxawa tesnikishii (nom. ined.)]|nr:hypothetical protein H2203_004500 [Dothideales sp. JES 119]